MPEYIPTGGAAPDADSAPRTPATSRPGAPNAGPDDVTLRVNGEDFAGWEGVRVTRRLLGCPSDFDLELTERYPTRPYQVFVKPGQTCEIWIGSDLVLAGYIDRYNARISPSGHQVRVQGRSKCEDIVDSHITGDQLHGMQMVTSSLLTLATSLCAPYGVSVRSLTGDNVPLHAPNTPLAPLQFNAILTETPWEIIERVARYAGVLVYDDADGNLVLANVATSAHASGFAEGVNVQGAAVTYAMDGRFSDYLPVLMSVNFYGSGTGGSSFARVYDKGVSDLTRADGKPRFRQRIVVSEQVTDHGYLAVRRAQWEMVRRVGQSQAVRLTCDNWRDGGDIDGKGRRLWEPNATADVYLPALKLAPSEPWVISEVTYSRDVQRGTVADLVLMPKEAFQPEPIVLTDFVYDPSQSPASNVGAAAPDASSSPAGPNESSSPGVG